MFESANQIHYLFESLFIGCALGIIYEIISFFELLASKKPLTVALDIAFCAFGLFAYYELTAYFAFPNIRAYMPIGVISGYLIARAVSVGTVGKFTANAAEYLRRKIYGRIEKTKDTLRGYGNSGGVFHRVAHIFDLANSDARRKARGGEKIAAGNRPSRNPKRTNPRRNRTLATGLENRGKGKAIKGVNNG